MEPLGHGALRFRHLGDLREYVAFPVRPARARAAARRLQLLGVLPHRGSFLAVKPVDALPAVLLADGRVPVFAGFLSAIAKLLRAPNESEPLDLRGG
jgi:hypothetical protein